MNDKQRTAAQEAIDAAWSATSKLESQINRQDLPESYKQIMSESYEALRKLQHELRVEQGNRSLFEEGMRWMKEQKDIAERRLAIRRHK